MPLAYRFSTKLVEVLEARATGTKVVEPRRRLRQRQFVGSNASEDGRVGAPNALWVWKLAR